MKLMSKNKVPYVLLVGIEDQLADVFDTKQEIIDITRSFAKNVDKEVPVTHVGYETKKEILRKNIGCFSDDEIFDFMFHLE